MTKLTISVTQEDIDLGERSNCSRCPIARAGRRAFQIAQVPNDNSFTVTNSCIYPVSDSRIEHALPMHAIDFISEFDNGSPNLFPFSFEIDIDKS